MPSAPRSCPHCKAALPSPGRVAGSTHCPACGKPLAAAPPAPAQAGWYYAKNGQRFGPLSAAQLRALAANGTLHPTDQVSRAGTQKWVAAGSVQGLFAAPATPAVARVAAPSVGAAPAPAKPAAPLGSRQAVLARGHVVTEGAICMQCGVCSYNCPMGIDVRAHSRRGRPVLDSRCLTCGECVRRCPRGVPRIEPIPLFSE